MGNSNRTVGATLMNATSSRAHTIVTISLTQLMKEDGVYTYYGYTYAPDRHPCLATTSDRHP